MNVNQVTAPSREETSSIASQEQAVVFGAPQALVGVVAPGDRERPALLLLNAGVLHRVGAQRMNVDLARALGASSGLASLRFDLSGIGDSPPRADNLPFREASLQETIAAMDYMQSTEGQRTFVLVGLCSGADQAFQVALRDERVVGCVLLDPYPYETPGFRVHRLLRPLRRAETWRRALRGEYGLVNRARRIAERDASLPRPVDPGLAVRDVPPREEAERGFHTLLDRGTQVYVIFTAGQLGTYNHEGQFRDMYPSLGARTELKYTYFAQADHTFSVRAVRALLVEHVQRWADARWPGSGAR